MENKFTNGPWKYENICGLNKNGFPSHLHRISTKKENVFVVHMENNHQENDPDAILIAAAPDLLAACEAAIKYINLIRSLDDEIGKAVIKQLWEAKQEAKGE